MHTIQVETLNSNDTTFTVAEWCVTEGQAVSQGDLVAIVETSKAATEVTAEASGVLHIARTLGVEYPFNTAIGYIFPSQGDYDAFSEEKALTTPAVTSDDAGEALVTAPARALAHQHGISDQALQGLGKLVVRTEDVERLVASRAESGTFANTRLDTVQRAVANTVTVSHREIPAAFVVMRIDVTQPVAALPRLVKQTGHYVGLVELFIKAIAGAAADFPNCFAGYQGDGSIRVPARPGIGLTFDTGNGLFVPVVKDVATKNLSDVARSLLEFRKRAVDRRFSHDDLEGGNITLSLSMDEGVVLSVPIVFPGQSCAVSLGAVVRTREPKGDTWSERATINVGLAYDHRTVNGREATRFLRRIGQDLAHIAA